MNGTQANDEEQNGRDVYEHGSTVGPSLTRRRVIQGLAVGGAAAAMPGTALADHGSEDPIDVNTDSYDDDGEQVRPARVAAGAAVGGAVVAGPAGAAAGAGLGYAAGAAENEYGVIGDWMFGSYEDRVNSQLQTDIHSHATTVSNENSWNLKQFDDRLSLGRNVWIAEAQFAVIQEMQERGVSNSTTTSTSTETETSSSGDRQAVIDAGVDAVLNAASVAQENLLAFESASLLRYASFDAREDAEDITEQAVAPRPHASDEDLIVEGVKPLHVTLLNGETVESWGLHVTHTNTEDGDIERVIHSHAADMELVGTDDSDLPVDASKLYDLVEEFSHNSTDGHVEYTDPETGETIRTIETDSTGPVQSVGGTPVTRVHHPTYIGSSNKHVHLFEQSDVAGITDGSDNNDGLAGYWTMNVNPLISVLASEIETFADDAFDAVNAGEIAIEDLITPSIFAAELARDWSESGDTGMSRELLANLGVDTDLETSMDIVVADQFDPSTVVSSADRGHSESWSHSLVNAPATIDFALKFRDGASDGAGGVIIPPNGEETVRLTASDYTDNPDDPSWALQSVDVTLSNGDSVSARMGSDSNGGAVGELWHDDLATSGTYTVDSVDVTYTSDGSEYTETVASPGISVTLDPDDTGWTYADCALATDWRPHGGIPENWSETIKSLDSFEGVTMSETSSSVDVQVGFKHDGQTGGEGRFTVADDQSLHFDAVSGDTGNVTGVIISLSNQSADVTASVSNASATIPHTDMLPGDGTGEFTISDVTIEYNDGSGGTATTKAGTVSKTLIPETIDLPQYDFLVGKWYDTDNADSDDSVVLVTSDGGWVDINTGDAFKITAATGVNGESMDGVTLSDTNRRTLNVDRVEEETRRAIELQKESDGGGSGGGGGGSGGGGSIGLGGLAVGGGLLGALYLWATNSDGSNGRFSR